LTVMLRLSHDISMNFSMRFVIFETDISNPNMTISPLKIYQNILSQ